MPTPDPRKLLSGDLWGGFAAMLVALPAAIAFGVSIYSPLGTGFAPVGALAGILGATVVGLVAAGFGGTDRLVSAPCAPAAAVLAALAAEYARAGASPEAALTTLVLIALLAGVMQLGLGAVGVGQLIKYVPYPVVSGYLSAVGLIIIASQIPKLLGVADGGGTWSALLAPREWRLPSIVVAVVVIGVMLGAGRLTRRVPAAVLALACGVAAYFALGWQDPGLWSIDGNPLVVGRLAAEGDLLGPITARWLSVGQFAPEALVQALVPALTLAALLSIDTLKTCVMLDTVNRSQHDSNRELIGQGLANAASALLGGIPGSGTMGPTLVNVASGAQTRRSGGLAGGFALAAFLLLAPVIAWVPVSALAAILVVVGARMIDWHSFALLRSPLTRFDFAVVATVVGIALMQSLIVAAGAGVALAIALFIREQTRSSVVRAKVEGGSVRSKRVRHERELRILQSNGAQSVVVELQGSLFFGTANQLLRALEPEAATRRYLILDLRRVQSIDLTASHVLVQIEKYLSERGGYLVFAEIPRHLPTGLKLKKYLKQVGLVQPESARAFRQIDDALEWVEEQVLAQNQAEPEDEAPLRLGELEIFRGLGPDALAALEACLELRAVAAGEGVFAQGEESRELYLIQHGRVRLGMPVSRKDSYNLATFGRGDFFGEMAFLDGSPRSADALALEATRLYVLTRERFDALATRDQAIALALLEGLARILAMRLRFMDAELRAWRA